jgi:hypothetical protein
VAVRLDRFLPIYGVSGRARQYPEGVRFYAGNYLTIMWSSSHFSQQKGEVDWIRAKAPTDSELVFGLKRTKDAGKEGASDDDYRM